MTRPTRRRYLAGLAGAATAPIAGCLGAGSEDDAGTDGDGGEAADGGGSGPPLAAESLVLPDDTEALSEAVVSGGVSQDGIPSIDDPQFVGSEEADGWLAGREPVFGVERNGAVRAYPQRVLVWHEIVNDVVGGEALAITYCPLTGTAQGFERGDTEFGVSGRLLNSNLVMYDRATESYWPQMLATAIRGELEDEVLREVPVTWTSWERWHDAHPDTEVLSDETGYARDYGDDPYGSYAPREGFYADDSLPFEPYHPVENSLHPKDVVLGARTRDGALAVHKDSLAEAGLLEPSVGGTGYVVAYDPDLDTGYVYRDPDEHAVSAEDGGIAVGGERFPPGKLPLERVLRYDALWFAWAGYYPETGLVR